MSIHLMVVASYLPKEVITQSQKLALQKLADSADDETRLSRPGLARLAAWVGVNEKRAITVVTELVAKGLVERVQTGKAGRAAVYRVFPNGIPAIPSTADLKARLETQRAAPKNPAKVRPGVKRAAPAKPAMTARDVEERVKDKAQAPQEKPPQGGFHEGNPGGDEGQVPRVEPGEFQAGNPVGSTGGTPSFLGSSSVLPFPLPPRLSPQGSLPATSAPPTSRLRHRSRDAPSTRATPLPPAALVARTRARNANGSKPGSATPSGGQTMTTGTSGTGTRTSVGAAPTSAPARCWRRGVRPGARSGTGRARPGKKYRPGGESPAGMWTLPRMHIE